MIGGWLSIVADGEAAGVAVTTDLGRSARTAISATSIPSPPTPSKIGSVNPAEPVDTAAVVGVDAGVGVVTDDFDVEGTAAAGAVDAELLEFVDGRAVLALEPAEALIGAVAGVGVLGTDVVGLDVVAASVAAAATVTEPVMDGWKLQ